MIFLIIQKNKMKNFLFLLFLKTLIKQIIIFMKLIHIFLVNIRFIINQKKTIFITAGNIENHKKKF